MLRSQQTDVEKPFKKLLEVLATTKKGDPERVELQTQREKLQEEKNELEKQIFLHGEAATASKRKEFAKIGTTLIAPLERQAEFLLSLLKLDEVFNKVMIIDNTVRHLNESEKKPILQELSSKLTSVLNPFVNYNFEDSSSATATTMAMSEEEQARNITAIREKINKLDDTQKLALIIDTLLAGEILDTAKMEHEIDAILEGAEPTPLKQQELNAFLSGNLDKDQREILRKGLENTKANIRQAQLAKQAVVDEMVKIRSIDAQSFSTHEKRIQEQLAIVDERISKLPTSANNITQLATQTLKAFDAAIAKQQALPRIINQENLILIFNQAPQVFARLIDHPEVITRLKNKDNDTWQAFYQEFKQKAAKDATVLPVFAKLQLADLQPTVLAVNSVLTNIKRYLPDKVRNLTLLHVASKLEHSDDLSLRERRNLLLNQIYQEASFQNLVDIYSNNHATRILAEHRLSASQQALENEGNNSSQAYPRAFKKHAHKEERAAFYNHKACVEEFENSEKKLLAHLKKTIANIDKILNEEPSAQSALHKHHLFSTKRFSDTSAISYLKELKTSLETMQNEVIRISGSHQKMQREEGERILKM